MTTIQVARDVTGVITAAEARDAIYVDFECLATKPVQAMLLGVLVGSEGEQLEQIIVDQRLAPARVANRRCRVATASAAVTELLSAAVSDKRTIVGWSFFDRDRLIAAAPELEPAIRARYRNALPLARPWRSALHPDFAVVREDPHAPKHTLDKYAQLAGYPGVAQFRHAAPARWIRHVLSQLEATKGSYRRTTTQTKRDWHKLLEYNRHDCLALRHIVLKASHEFHSWRAYERTRFCIDEDARPRFCFMTGSRNKKLEALLRRHGTTRWAFITAWNPASVVLDREENDARQATLRRQVETDGFAVITGEGVGEDPGWLPEASLLILGMHPGQAVKVGQQFGQLAVLVGRRGGPAHLVSCAQVAE